MFVTFDEFQSYRSRERKREGEKRKKKWKKIFDCTKRLGFAHFQIIKPARTFYFSRSLAFASSKIHLLSPPLFRSFRLGQPNPLIMHANLCGTKRKTKLDALRRGDMKEEKEKKNVSFLKNDRWIVHDCGIRNGNEINFYCYLSMCWEKFVKYHSGYLKLENLLSRKRKRISNISRYPAILKLQDHFLRSCKERINRTLENWQAFLSLFKKS